MLALWHFLLKIEIETCQTLSINEGIISSFFVLTAKLWIEWASFISCALLYVARIPLSHVWNVKSCFLCDVFLLATPCYFPEFHIFAANWRSGCKSDDWWLWLTLHLSCMAHCIIQRKSFWSYRVFKSPLGGGNLDRNVAIFFNCRPIRCGIFHNSCTALTRPIIRIDVSMLTGRFGITRFLNSDRQNETVILPCQNVTWR